MFHVLPHCLPPVAHDYWPQCVVQPAICQCHSTVIISHLQWKEQGNLPRGKRLRACKPGNASGHLSTTPFRNLSRNTVSDLGHLIVTARSPSLNHVGYEVSRICRLALHGIPGRTTGQGGPTVPLVSRCKKCPASVFLIS